eukprot:COSAG05_NODE_1348_length_5116_cov_2.541957_2_plen_95_part_00
MGLDKIGQIWVNLGITCARDSIIPTTRFRGPFGVWPTEERLILLTRIVVFNIQRLNLRVHVYFNDISVQSGLRCDHESDLHNQASSICAHDGPD